LAGRALSVGVESGNNHRNVQRSSRPAVHGKQQLREIERQRDRGSEARRRRDRETDGWRQRVRETAETAAILIRKPVERVEH
jgi:hypothetical protein